MKLDIESSLSLDDLKGAWLTNENDMTFRVDDFYVNLDDGLGTDDMFAFHDVWVTLIPIDLKNGEFSKTEKQGVTFQSLKNWTIKLNRGSF
tara:strand:+ start:34 stop:306 length:273 start_codon:yes stop_codon:yes gene_type:complete